MGGGERGQATLEWVGLVLGMALALGGAAVAAGRADFAGEADGLGQALARRVTCAAGGACAGPRSGGLLGGRAAPGSGSPRARAPAGKKPRAPGSTRRTRGAAAPRGALERGRRVLRALGKAGRYGGAFCLAHRRFEYDLEHPRTPRQGIPLGDTLDLLDSCLNPVGFLFR